MTALPYAALVDARVATRDLGVFRIAFTLFALGALAGLLFAGAGPVPFIRGLGIGAAVAGALGMLVAAGGWRMAVTALASARPVQRGHDSDAAIAERLPVWPGVSPPAEPSFAA